MAGSEPVASRSVESEERQQSSKSKSGSRLNLACLQWRYTYLGLAIRSAKSLPSPRFARASSLCASHNRLCLRTPLRQAHMHLHQLALALALSR